MQLTPNDDLSEDNSHKQSSPEREGTTGQASHDRETPTAAQSATPEARRALDQGSQTVNEGVEGVADVGREPEYYAAKHDAHGTSSGNTDSTNGER
jgi:hypothetical protein